jgi:hypothetical protein
MREFFSLEGDEDSLKESYPLILQKYGELFDPTFYEMRKKMYNSVIDAPNINSEKGWQLIIWFQNALKTVGDKLREFFKQTNKNLYDYLAYHILIGSTPPDPTSKEACRHFDTSDKLIRRCLNMLKKMAEELRQNLNLPPQDFENKLEETNQKLEEKLNEIFGLKTNNHSQKQIIENQSEE